MDLRTLLQRIDLLKTEIDAMRPLDADREGRIMQKFRLDWNYHSSNIEGNSLTFGETKTFLLHGLTAQGKPLKDHLEIRGHNEAIHGLEDIIRGERELTEHWIKTLHQVILGEPYTMPAISPEGIPTQRQVTPGRYKMVANHVRTVTGEPFYFATPEETPIKMEELLDWYRTSLADESLHPLIFAATFHYKFIRIHPFDDGNGRIARLLMNLILMVKRYPPAIIRTDDKENYYRALRQADGDDIEAFIGYIGEQLLWSLELFVRGAKGEDIDEEDDIDKQIALFKAELSPAGDNAPQESKSVEAVKRVLGNSILPMLEIVVNNLQKYDDLFVRRRFQMFLSGQFISRDNLEASEKKDDHYLRLMCISDSLSTLESSIETWLSNARDISKFEFIYEWQGYKHAGTSAFSHEKKIEIVFDDFSYAINQNYSGRTAFRKLYHQIYTINESNQIAKELKTQVLAYIQGLRES